MKRKLRIGIVGVGHFGKNHVRSLKNSKYDLIGFYDIDKSTSDQVEKEFNVSQFPSYNSLLKEVDVIDVVVPTVSHFEVAEKAILSGKHVFIEKPVTSTLEEALKLKELADAHQVKIQVGHIERFNPAFTTIRDHISEPKFIELHRLGQFHPRNKDVPVVLDLQIHDIDIILNIIQSEPAEIHSSGVNIISDSPDITNSRIRFKNGCVVNMTSSRISMKQMRKLRLFQPHAYISIDFLEKTAEIVQVEDVTGREVDDPFALIMDLGEGKSKKQIFFDKPEIKQVNAMVEELHSFYDAIENDTTPEVSIDDGYSALKLAFEIIGSMNKSVLL